MLVRLISSTSGEMIMFAEHAHVLFGWIGKECTAHGVFTREQLPGVVAALRRCVEEEKLAARRLTEEKRAASGQDEGDDGEESEKHPEETVSLIQRAQPLIRLMEWTVKEEGFIVWEADKDF